MIHLNFRVINSHDFEFPNVYILSALFLFDATFLQNSRSFEHVSILEENCGANIDNVTSKCKTFGDW